MKVYTKVVMDWDGNILEEESHEYDGPVAEAKGGGGDSTTVQKAEPWSGAQPHLTTIMSQAGKLYNQGGPQFYPNQTFANRDPMENFAQTRALQYATGGAHEQAKALGQANISALNAPDVANNPYVGGMADMIQARMIRNLGENQLPMIRGGAVAAGQLGGSRQGIAEGQAIGRTNEAMGDALAQLYGGAYDSGLQQQARAMGFAPQTIEAGRLPAQMMGDVGAYNRGEKELLLQDQMARFNYNQQLPWQNLQNYNNIVSGTPWGSTSTSDVGGSNRGFSATGALGGAATGMAFGPVGAIAGGILGGLF